MSSIPEEDVQQQSLVAHQVFPDAIPSASAQESKAKVAEDISATSADEVKEENREAIPPTSYPVVQEDVIMLDPLLMKPLKLKLRRLPPLSLLKPMTRSWLKTMWSLKLMLSLKTLCNKPLLM